MKVALLGLEFNNSNMGCQALSYSFTKLFSKAAQEVGISVQYYAIMFKDFEHDEQIECGGALKGIVIRYKTPSFWTNLRRLFKDCDLIVDFTGGDSFSDIYGTKRFLLASFMKIIAIRSKTPFMLGPQTYGPYKRFYNKMVARWIIKRTKWAFTRDNESEEMVKKVFGIDITRYTDVAFALPYEKVDLPENGKVKVGINVSGLLWNGGYSFAKLPLSVDYRRYCEEVIDKLIHDGRYEVYLIPYVGLPTDDVGENDYAVSVLLHNRFPETVLVSKYHTPMDLKGYISAMDAFIGARMHATIAAFSSNVATIPFSYSKKFEGLFGTLHYNRTISARTCSTEQAVADTIKMIKDFKVLKSEVEECVKVAYDMILSFTGKLSEIIREIQNV